MSSSLSFFYFIIKLTHENIHHDALIALEKSKTKQRKHLGEKNVREKEKKRGHGRQKNGTIIEINKAN